MLDIGSWSWWTPKLASPLPPMAFHTAALSADQIFVFGGSVGEQIGGDVIMINTVSTEWQERAPR